MSDLIIENVKVYSVGPDAPRVRWALDQTEMYQANVIVRMQTREGLEGIGGAIAYTEHDFDRSLAEALRSLLPEVVGVSALDRELIWKRLATRRIPLTPQALSLIDVACWDVTAKYADVPLYRLLGGARGRIRSYASTPMLESTQEYLDLVVDLKRQGFHAVKVHPWCLFDDDMRLVEALGERFAGSGLRFMLDVDAAYTFDQALKMGRLLDELGWTWFEAPLPDTDLQGYRDLRERVDIGILPGGNTLLSLEGIADGLRRESWSSARIDVTNCGGFTAARKVMALAEGFGKTVEVQSWGYTPSQAANLHLMLGYHNCDYFEQAVPYEPYEYGSKTPIRTDPEGFVRPPEGSGLGIELDWPTLEAATYLRLDSSM